MDARITKEIALKILVFLVLFFFFGALTEVITPLAKAEDPLVITEVFPTGDPSLDVQNVQAAVDVGGLVLLGAGTFDFGDYGTVYVDNPAGVEIRGEWNNEIDRPMTWIHGGFNTFYVGRKKERPLVTPDNDPCSGLPPCSPTNFFYCNPCYWCATVAPYFYDPSYAEEDYYIPVSTTIKNIEFVDPFMTAIWAVATTGLTVERCHFVGGRRANYACSGVHPECYAVTVWAHTFFPWYTGQPLNTNKSVISGTVKIRDCFVDGENTEVPVLLVATHPSQPEDHYRQTVFIGWDGAGNELFEDFWVPNGAVAWPRDGAAGPMVVGHRGLYIGIFSTWEAAELEISGNQVCEVDAGIFSVHHQGQLLINRNTIEPGYVNEYVTFLQSGIAVWDNYFDLNEVFSSDTTITRNWITKVAEGRWGAIDFGGLFEGVIDKNNIQLDSGIGLWGMFSNGCTIGENKIEGAGLSGVALDYSDSNTFRGNNLTHLDALTFYFGEYTHSNIVEGYTGQCNVVDLNPYGPYSELPNLITGCKSKAGWGDNGDWITAASWRKLARENGFERD